MTHRWYEIRNKAADSAEVFIYDSIGGFGISAAQFIGELKGLAKKDITVRIHSPGGSVLDGLAIFNALLRHDGGVTVQIDGLAASMAGVIAMAGKTVKMAANGFFMIHNVSGGAQGSPDDLRRAADLGEKMQDGLVNIFAKRTGKSASEIDKVMANETWFTAQEAKDFGLIDEITDELPMAAEFDALKNFKHVPIALVDTRGEAMSAANLETITAELATARESLAAAQGQAQKNFADYTAQVAMVAPLLTERDAITAKHGELQAKFSELYTSFSALTEANTKLTTDLEAAQTLSAEKINAEAARVLAASGHKPIAGDAAVGPAAPAKKDFSHIPAGLARAIAIHQAENAAAKAA